MRYYYNAESNSFAVATNFDFKETPQGYVEITQEQYNELIESDKESASESE